VKLVLGGEPYVVWRTDAGCFITHAVCPHRGADLSTGRVCGTSLECPYHGWTIAPDGGLFSPFEGKGKGHARVHALTERFEVLWLNGDEAHFAALKQAGDFFGPLTFAFDAPLHITVDGFCDGAHVPFVHARNGAAPSQARETTFSWEEDDAGVSIHYDYSQRGGTIFSLLHAFRKTRWSVLARMEFRPLRVQYTIAWYLPASRRVLHGTNRNTYYFYPAAPGKTTGICLLLHRGLPRWLGPLRPVFGWMLRRLTVDLMREDLAMVGRVLNTDPGFAACRLEAFDAPVVRVRKRMFESAEFGASP
jgi:phenylpropionate dioxygenase-like ring-hydroxylating dioxygenase large terminal subunit